MLRIGHGSQLVLGRILALFIAQLVKAPGSRRVTLTTQATEPQVSLLDFGVDMRDDVQDVDMYREAIAARLREAKEAAEKAFTPEASEDDCPLANCCIISQTSLLVRESEDYWKIGPWGLAAIVAPPTSSDDALPRINLYRLTSLHDWYCKTFKDPVTGVMVTADSNVQVLKLNDIDTPMCPGSGQRQSWPIFENRALHEAAQNCQTEQVASILLTMSDATVMGRNARGRTALHPAASMGCLDVVVLLLQRMTNAAVGVQDEHMWTALQEAVANLRASHLLIRELISRMDDEAIVAAPSYSFAYNGRTALHIAAGEAKAAVVREILERLPTSATIQTQQGQTALHSAAVPGTSRQRRMISSQEIRETALALVGRMDDQAVCMQERLGWTALHRAARFGESVFVKALLETSQGRASLHVADTGGHTPLLAAVNHGHVDVFHEILPYLQSASFATKSHHGQTALHLAATLRGATGNNVEQVQSTLIQEVIERMDYPTIIATDSEGKTALHCAASKGTVRFQVLHGSAAAVRLILGAMRDNEVGLQDFQQRTALHWAAESGLSDAVPALLGRMDQATAELQDSDGSTALHLAAEQGHVPVLDHLLSSWLCISQTDGQGLTALKRARRAGHVQATFRLSASHAMRRIKSLAGG